MLLYLKENASAINNRVASINSNTELLDQKTIDVNDRVGTVAEKTTSTSGHALSNRYTPIASKRLDKAMHSVQSGKRIGSDGSPPTDYILQNTY
jgi:hypothetical protein